MCSTLFLRAHEHIYFMECALSQNVLLPLLMVHFVTRMYYYYYYYKLSPKACGNSTINWIGEEGYNLFKNRCSAEFPDGAPR